mmetsp:Transcript_115374/g.326916  ORF Transcript_115374/g.326916 Transcript_115374/m.326916 type:complete len:243 (-) Transcript_115374:139-867(-)
MVAARRHLSIAGADHWCRVSVWCMTSATGPTPPHPSSVLVPMHRRTFRYSSCTAFVFRNWLNHTSIRTLPPVPLPPMSLSTRRMPVIMSTGSMVAPMTPSTRLFQYSSSCPPPSDALSRNCRCPPSAFASSSHCGLMPSRNTMSPSTMWKPSATSRIMRLERSSEGCGSRSHVFQKSSTVSKAVIWRVDSLYPTALSLPAINCSHTAHRYLRGRLGGRSSWSPSPISWSTSSAGTTLPLKLR